MNSILRIIFPLKILSSLNKVTEFLIYFVLIFSPWAFGTTENWSTWIMNITSYVLGIILVYKITMRYIYRDCYIINSYKKSIFENLLLVSLVCLLIYITTSAINWRGDFDFETKKYFYSETYSSNLPHSYNSSATWHIFYLYLGLFLLFYSILDWLKYNNLRSYNEKIRLKKINKLIVLLCLNGGLLTFIGILQRFYFGEGNGKLLFLVEANINKENAIQFGPFAYRANAASYINLIWPIGIGLIMTLHKKNTFSRKNQDLYLFFYPFVILAASAPIITSSRGGAFVMLLQIMSIFAYIVLSKFNNNVRLLILFKIILILLLGFYIGGASLLSRVPEIFYGSWSNRIPIYELCLKMIEQYSLFGSGPGSFETVSMFEINHNSPFWNSWAHCDPLEFRLTFGLFGVIILIIIILTIISHLILQIYMKINSMNIYILIATIGVLTHSLVDFPLQTHSILILLTIIIAIPFSLKYKNSDLTKL